MTFKAMGSIMALIAAMMFVSVPVHADNVTRHQAEAVANSFFASHGKATPEGVKPCRAMKRYVPTISTAEPYYVFNTADSSAFVIVSGETGTRQILAYGLDRPFDTENIAPGVAYWLERYERQIDAIRKSGTKVQYVEREPRKSASLIQTAEWNQSYDFWWNFTPAINGQKTHAGCVATAMAIIMRHNEWPLHGYGRNSYTTATYKKKLSATFENQYYEIASLPYENESSPEWTADKQTQVARLLYHCGIAVNMDYGPDGSSASSPELGMYYYFGYGLSSCIWRDALGDDQKWMTFICDEIDEGYPLLYRGADSNGAGGHQFVCDGYDRNGMLHFNFGWSGYGNGFYSIDEMVPEGNIANGDYSYEQAVVIGLRPDPEGAGQPKSQLAMRYLPEYEPGMSIELDGKAHASSVFSVLATVLENVSHSTFKGDVAVFLCDKDGNPKQMLGYETIDELDSGWYYYTFRIYCHLPSNYVLSEGDQLRLFSATDGKTWLPVNCCVHDKGIIPLASCYDPTPMYLAMIEQEEGNDAGLTCSRRKIVKNVNFTVTANNLENVTPEDFYGTVGVFLCDNLGNRKQLIGSSVIQGLEPYYYYYGYEITCRVPTTATVESNDRLYLFVQPNTVIDDAAWAVVPCYDPELGYIACDPTGIDAPSHLSPLDKEAPCYYTLQGTRLPGRPARTGTYIMRKGDKGMKLLVP